MAQIKKRLKVTLANSLDFQLATIAQILVQTGKYNFDQAVEISKQLLQSKKVK